MKTLSRSGWHSHRVHCSSCDYERRHDDVRDAVNDYVDHDCRAETDPEETA